MHGGLTAKVHTVVAHRPKRCLHRTAVGWLLGEVQILGCAGVNGVGSFVDELFRQTAFG
jgi:hypothetical protein